MVFDWSLATIGDFVDLQRGNTYQSKLLDTPGPVLLGLASIERDGGFRDDKLRTYGGESPAKLLVYPGDIYVSLKDVTQAGDLLGSVARVPVSISVGRMTQDTVKLIFKNELIDRSYLYWVLRSPEYREYCRARGMGTTNLSLSRDDFLSFSVPEPTATRLLIQKSLDSIEERISLNRCMNQILEAMAQAIFKSWFVDFDPVKAKIAAVELGEDPLRAAMRVISGKTDAELDEMPPEHHAQLAATAALFPDALEDSASGEIPRTWGVGTLGSVTSYLGRGTSPKYLDEGGVLVLNQKCIRNFRLDESKGRRHDPTQRAIDGRLLELGDVLVNSTGVGTLGRVAQVLCLNEPTIVDSHVTVVRTNSELNSSYIGQYFIWKHPDIEAMGEGSTGQTELSRAKLSELLVLKPGASVLKVFDRIIFAFNDEISVSDCESRALAEMRNTLLQKLIPGELSVDALNENADNSGAP